MDGRGIRTLIPSLMTIGNLALGLIALLLSYHGFIATAAIVVIFGMILDAFDGRIARWLRCESQFGKELDSLSDIVTFGVAPAFVMYVSVLRFAGWIGIVSALLFPICGAMRLARYNVQTSSTRYFVGLPITAAGGILATLALYRDELTPEGLTMSCAMVLLSCLMISKAKYPNFKRIGFPRSAVIVVPALAIFVYVAFRFDRAIASRLVFLPLALYALYGVGRRLRKRAVRKHEAEGDTEPS